MTTEQLIILDRQAILGRLSAGLVHAINNVLSGILGQVDLLMLMNGGNQLKTDLEQIADNCEGGVHIAHSLTRIIAAFQNEGPLDTLGTFNAMTHLLGRIYRRSGLKAELVAEGDIKPVHRGNLFLQSAFHLAIIAFEEASARNLSEKERFPIPIEVNGDHLHLKLSFPTLDLPGSLPTELPEKLTGKEYHYYIVGQLLDLGSAKLNHPSESNRFSISWPVSGKKL